MCRRFGDRCRGASTEPAKRLRVTDSTSELTVHAATSQTSYAALKVRQRLDLTGNGYDTRDRVLLRDGLGIVAGAKCTITAVHWRSIYDGTIITVRSQGQIDHIVPLANAWRSGASRWTRARRVRFANDLTDPQLTGLKAAVAPARFRARTNT